MSSEARPTGPGTSTGGDSGDRDERPGTHAGSARRIVVNTLYRAAGEGTAKLASFALFLIAARRLGTGGFGEITFALSLATALFVLSGLGTDGLLAREVARDRSRLHGFMGNILLLKLATSAVLMVAAVAIGFAWSASSEARIAVVLISASAAIENIGRTWTSAFQAYERMGYTSAALILQRSLTAAAGIAVLLAGGGVVAVSAVFLIGSIAGLTFLVIMLPRALGRLTWSVDVRRLVPLFRVALPIGIAGLFFTILMRVDTVILGLIERDNPDEVGLYGAAFRLCEATMFLSWSLGSAIYPWFSRQRADETAVLSRGYELSLLALALLLTPIGLIFALLASPLIRLLYGDEYLGATASLRLLGVVVVAYGLNYMTATTLTAHDRPGLFTRLLPTVAVLNVALSLALIPSLGATGAALAAAVSGAVLAVLGMWQTRSVLGGIRLLRILAVPAIAGIGMTAAILLTPGGLVVQLVVGVVAFALAAAAALRTVTPAEFDLLRSARRGIRKAGRGRETP